jgi:hypothetical protein
VGCIPINTWCGFFPDIDVQHHHNWSNIVKTWNRQAADHGIGVMLTDNEVPMIHFARRPRFRVTGRAVYVENGPTRSGHCDYVFDMEDLGARFPDLRFCCTSKPNSSRPNVIDCSTGDLVDLSAISDQCEAIVGKGSGPFMCTLTYPNLLKPKAVIDFKAPRFWEYRNNPLQYLSGTPDLLSFLEAVQSAGPSLM